ncbi:MAG: hypothetical protein E7Z90_02755 [Cyanobacteria bacterium SIG29]|nr:hypothetical protein [Cyanobacteria bacterium SIG29]
MEENNNNNERKHVCFENHCWKMCLGMVIAAFLGGFFAFYFVADQVMNRFHYPYMMQPHHPIHHPYKMEKRMFDDMERMYQNDMKAFDKMMKKVQRPMRRNAFDMPFYMMDSVKIKTEFDDNKFNVIVCLKPFNGDENKVNYNVSNRKLTVFGSSQVKEEGLEQDIEFSQDYILPKNADIENITKVKDGNKLIISVPIKQ